MCCRNDPLWEGASAKLVGEINALFCATDTIAIGAIQYCRSQGLRARGCDGGLRRRQPCGPGGLRAADQCPPALPHGRGQGRPPAAGPAVLQHVPILIAFSAAKVFGSNPFLGVVIGMIMIHPTCKTPGLLRPRACRPTSRCSAGCIPSRWWAIRATSSRSSSLSGSCPKSKSGCTRSPR